MNRPVAVRDRPTFPEFKTEFGEDPARFLYADLDPWPRLRAIDDPELLRAYARVEAQRETPRKPLLGRINQRIATLADGPDSTAVAADGGIQR